MSNKLPTLTSPIAPDVRQFLNRMREAFEGPGRVLTRDDLVLTGVFEENTTGGLDFLEPGEAESCIAPPAALNLVAAGAMTSVILTWDNEPYANTPCYSYAEVWRASSNDLGTAVLIGTTSSGVYADAVGSDGSNYYWVRFVNVLSDVGPFNATAGVLGATSPDVAYLLSQLTTSITNGQLASTLAASINSTFHQNDAPTTKKDGTTLVAGDVWIDANGNDAVSIYNGSSWVSAAVATQAYVGTEITQQVGYCERTVTEGGAKNVATAYTTKTTCEAASVSGETFSWKDDVALAGEVKTVTTTAGGNTATIQTNTGSINGIVAKHTVKIDNAGHLSGYGLISTNNDATPTAEFGIRADNFWVAPPAISDSSAPTTNLYKGKVWVHSGTGAVQYYSGSAWGTTPTTLPFIVKTTATTAADGNTIPAGVYMEDAYIQNSSIVTAKIGNAAVDTLQVKDAAIKTAKIDDAQITTAKIDDLAVTNAKVTALNAAKITAGTLDANRIGAASIESSHLKVTGTGAIIASTIGALKSFYQDNIPTSLAIGDLWVDTDDGNKLYRAASIGADEIAAGEWITVRDGTIATAQAAADSAATAATAAQSAANTATTTLANIADDDKLTPSEKQQAKTLWDAVATEYSGIVASASNASVSSTAYATAYTNLNTYLNTTPDVFDDMATTTDIARTTWDTRWSAYYGAKQALLDAIAAALKVIADAGVANAATAQTTATNAATAASNAQTAATAAQAELDDIADDDKLTPAEKFQAKTLWDAVYAEKPGILTSASNVSVASTTYLAKYDALNAYLNTTPDVFASFTTTTTIARTTWDTRWKEYYGQKQILLDAIAAALKVIADTIAGNVYYSGTTEIDGGKIRADTININEITVTPTDVGVGSSATSGERMVISGTKIIIYDSTSTNATTGIRVKIGDLS